MNRLVLAGLASVALASCGGDGEKSSAVDPGTRTGSPTVSTSTATTSPSPTSRTTVTVYFMHGEQIQAAHRRVPSTPGIGAAAVRELLLGPSAPERAAGLVTAIPARTQLRGLTIADGTATVDLSGSFESGGGSLSMRSRLSQIVFTLTRFATVKHVALRVDGEAVDSIGGEGVAVKPVLDRRDFEDLSPAILVESPALGDTVRSPIEVSGTANTFEATVALRVLDERDRPLAEYFTTATSGTGTRGTFRLRGVAFRAPADARTITLMAFEASAATGKPTKIVRVTLPLR